MCVKQSQWLALFLMACANTAPLAPPRSYPQDDSVQVAPPPMPGSLVLEARCPSLWLDHPNLFRVCGLVPGEEVVLLGSRAGQGAGPCSSDHGGLCLDVLAPRKLAAAIVDTDNLLMNMSKGLTAEDKADMILAHYQKRLENPGDSSQAN